MGEISKALFLSYASQDAEAAKRICDALRAAGVEVWFDQSELRGGDAWDQKIRKQIKECALFVPIISANTQARTEGYFRLEWRLADQRTHLMAKARPFLLPVVFDATRDAEAHVPDSFLEVQWTRIADDAACENFCAHVQTLLHGDGRDVSPRRPLVATDTNVGRLGETSLPPKSRRTWVAIDAVALAALIALAVWWSLKKSAPTATTPAVAPVTEADQLALRARNRVFQSRDQLQVAIDMAHHATDLTDDSARAWAVRARLDSLFILRGWDVSEERRQEAQTFAKRALALDPDATDAMLALAVVLQGQGAHGEVEALMRRAIALAPDDAMLRLALGDALSAQGKEEEALAVRQETFRRFPREPLAKYNLALSYEHAPTPDFDAALRAFDESVALQPYATTILHKVSLLAGWKGDLPAARRLLDGLDPLERTGDRAVGIAMMIGLLEHQPARTIEAGGRTARPYLEDNYVRGPKAWSLAHAYAMEGKPSLAQAQWRNAESVLRERLRAAPDDWFDQAGLGVTLAWLGQHDEAARMMAPLESIARESPQALRSRYLAYYRAGLGDASGAVQWLERILDRQELVTTKTLPLDPWWDKVRAAPEFQALLTPAQQSGSSSSGKTAKDTGNVAPANSIVVLPFANLSGDPAQEYFSDGLTEEILNALARERDLRVVPRTSAFSFKGKNLPLPEIGRSLNVAQVVEGSIRRAGDTVRIDCTLTRVSDGFAQPLPQFQREMKDASGIFALEDDVARAVVEKLTGRATKASVDVLTKNSEAYDCYLRGRALQTRSASVGKAGVEVIRLYGRAVGLDPSFALAWARLAEARFRSYGAATDRSPEVVTATRTAIDRALQAQPDLPEALIMRANWTRYVQCDYAAARRDLDRAEALQPPTAELRIAQALLARDTGDFSAARRLAEECLALDPRNGDHTQANASTFFEPWGYYVEADRLYVRALTIQGSEAPLPFNSQFSLRFKWRGASAALRLLDHAPVGRPGTDILRAANLWSLGRDDEGKALVDLAEEKANSAARGSTDNAPRASAELLAGLGEADLARRRAEEDRAKAEKELARDNRAPDVFRALVQAEIILGHRDAALATLEDWRGDAQRLPSVYRRMSDYSGRACKFYAQLGKADEAIALLREYLAAGFHLGYLLHDDPEFAPIRGDPRFQDLMKQETAWANSLPDPIDP